MNTYIRILKFAKPDIWVVPMYVLVVLLHTVFRIVNFTALIPVLQLLFSSGGEELKKVTILPEFSLSDQYFIDTFYYHFGQIVESGGKVEALYFICYILLGSVFLSNIFQYFSVLLQARVRIDTVSNLRNRIFGKLTLLEVGYFTEARKGDLISRISTDAFQVEVTVVNTLKVIFKEPFLILGFFFALFRISTEMTLYTLLLIPISAGTISLIAKRLKRRALKAQKSMARISSIVEETITGMRIIKAFTGRRYIVDKFDKEVKTYARHNYRMVAKNNLAGPISEFLGVAFLSIILIIGGQQVLSGSSGLDAAQFIVFLVIFSQLLNPTKAISNAFSNIQRGIAAGDRLFEIIDHPLSLKEKENPIRKNSFDQIIQFKNVSFQYDTANVLDNINLELKKGDVLAIVGASGSGKTTLAELLPRFYDPTRGKIEIDGIDLKELKLNDLRNLMGLVSQDSILFNDTVANNIAFGNPQWGIEKIQEAARIANAHEFIAQLDNGYDTMVGEGGSKLSGGQRQRLSIARAILKNPPILILDEATSALDTESEKSVQEAIYKLMKHRTTLVIAHRLSTIQNADKIVVLSEGKIIEEGTHDHLISRKGAYQKLIEMQAL